MAAHLPKFSHILETILYTKNVEQARHFYGTILGLNPLPGMSSERSQGYILGHTNLLIFALGKTTEDLVGDAARPEIRIPRHGPSEHILDMLMDDTKAPSSATSNALHQHYCFAAETVEDVKAWERYLIETQVPIIGRMEWSLGGYSVYFSDPDDHVGEIASRGIWPNWK